MSNQQHSKADNESSKIIEEVYDQARSLITKKSATYKTYDQTNKPDAPNEYDNTDDNSISAHDQTKSGILN